MSRGLAGGQESPFSLFCEFKSSLVREFELFWEFLLFWECHKIALIRCLETLTKLKCVSETEPCRLSCLTSTPRMSSALLPPNLESSGGG